MTFEVKVGFVGNQGTMGEGGEVELEVIAADVVRVGLKGCGVAKDNEDADGNRGGRKGRCGIELEVAATSVTVEVVTAADVGQWVKVRDGEASQSRETGSVRREGTGNLRFGQLRA